MKRTVRNLFAVGIGALVLMGSNQVNAADDGFAFLRSHGNVRSDPSGVWPKHALESENVRIFEYQLKRGDTEYLISQIWNENCSPQTCPTKLLRIESNGRRSLLLEDMMRQVIPSDSSLQKHIKAAAYARNPFRLSDDGRTLINGDFRFDLGDAK